MDQRCRYSAAAGCRRRCHRYFAMNFISGVLCARLGLTCNCICGHSLADHSAAATSITSADSCQLSSSASASSAPAPSPSFTRCRCCTCLRFTYIPNQPEEIGEGWLVNRKGFVRSEWSPKCVCGHGSLAHPKRRCKDCSCRSFVSGAWRCIVCDQRWEQHSTAVMTRSQRVREGLAVDERYFPFQQALVSSPSLHQPSQQHVMGRAELRHFQDWKSRKF